MWEIDFADRSEGYYTLKDTPSDKCEERLKQEEVLPRNIMYTTDPDLEGYSSLVNLTNRPDFFPITLELIKSGNASVDAVKYNKHWIMVGDRWEIRAQLKKIHENCFEFSFSGGERLFVSEFALGEPDE